MLDVASFSLNKTYVQNRRPLASQLVFQRTEKQGMHQESHQPRKWSDISTDIVGTTNWGEQEGNPEKVQTGKQFKSQASESRYALNSLISKKKNSDESKFKKKNSDESKFKKKNSDKSKFKKKNSNESKEGSDKHVLPNRDDIKNRQITRSQEKGKPILKKVAFCEKQIMKTHNASVSFDFKVGMGEKKSVDGTLYCPVEFEVNPYYEESKSLTNQWVLDQGLLTKESKAYERFCKADFNYLTAACYATESLDELTVCANFVAWLFVHDDFRDNKESPVHSDSAKIKEINLVFERILDHKCSNRVIKESKKDHDVFKVYPLVHALARALENILERLSTLAPDVPFNYFANGLKNYFQANVWEANNRKSEKVLSSLEYMQWRHYTSAVLPTFEIGAFTRKVSLDPAIRNHVYFKCLQEHASKTVCLVNDIFSFQKEQQEGIQENIVMVNKNLDNLSTEDAIKKGIKEANVQAERSLNIYDLLVNESNEQDAISFFQLPLNWISGNDKWSIKTKRYK